MTLVQLVQLIGDILTQVDGILSSPGLASTTPEWHQLYALRVHLNQQQEQLVALSIKLDDPQYIALTASISAAANVIKQQAADVAKVGTVISGIAQVASYIDQILALASKA